MRRVYLRLVAGVIFVASGFPVPGLAAQSSTLPDITPFLMDRAEEIALARSAAPYDLGADAAVWVLTRHGLVEAVAGTNGFACFVGRGWSGPIMIGPEGQRRVHPDLFDVALRAPHCFNPPAAASVLPMHVARTRYVLAGVPAEQVDARVAEDLAAGRLRAPVAGAVAYMMSAGQDLGPRVGSWRPHVMVYLPNLRLADWGIPGFTNDFPFVAEPGTPWAIAIMPMRVYSDGTQAPDQVTGRQR